MQFIYLIGNPKAFSFLTNATKATILSKKPTHDNVVSIVSKIYELGDLKENNSVSKYRKIKKAYLMDISD